MYHPPPVFVSTGGRHCQFPPATQGATSLSRAVKTTSPPPLSRGCLPPRRRWDGTPASLGPRGPPASPRHLLQQLRAAAEGSPGSAFVFPDSNYVCGSAAGAGDAAALHPEMTGGSREGGIGAEEALGRGGAHPAAGARRRIRGPGRRRATHLEALSCARRGEPCPRGAGRPLGTLGRRRRRAGRSAACP